MFLPYGQTIPDTGPLDGIPEPYDPRRHGKPLKDTRPQDNDALRPGFHLPAKQAPRFSGDAPPPLEDDFTDSYMGWRLTQGRGVYARFDLPDAPIPIGGAPGTGIIYAPTTTPANYGCVEITGIHYNDRTVWGAPYGDAFGVWDWCHNTHDFRYVTNSSAYAFRDPYVRSYTDEYGQTKKGYFITLSEQNPGSPVHSGDCWSALLYNFNRGLWEEKWTSCGVSERNDVYGWIMHETNDMAGVVNNTCFSMKSIAAAYVHDPTSER